MKKPIKIFVLGLVAGTFYLLMINPESSHTFGIHNYIILAALGVATAFIARIGLKSEHEKAILLTVGGFITASISPLLFEALVNDPNALEAAFNQAFITLFFAGHAALVGTFSATLFQNIFVTNNLPKYSRSSTRDHYYKYPVTE